MLLLKATFLIYYINGSDKKNQNVVLLSNLGEVLADSIKSATSTVLLIGGFVVIFSSFISIFRASGIFHCIDLLFSPIFDLLKIDTSFITPFFTGLLEITNGINLISCIAEKKLSVNILFTAFLLGFGGISILLQVWSIVSKTDLSIKPYLYGKILQGFFATFYTYIVIQFFPFFNFDL